MYGSNPSMPHATTVRHPHMLYRMQISDYLAICFVVSQLLYILHGGGRTPLKPSSGKQNAILRQSSYQLSFTRAARVVHNATVKRKQLLLKYGDVKSKLQQNPSAVGGQILNNIPRCPTLRSSYIFSRLTICSAVVSSTAEQKNVHQSEPPSIPMSTR